MDTEVSILVTTLANDLIELVRRLCPNWSKAYYRFCSEGTSRGPVSYVIGAEVCILDPSDHARFLERANTMSLELLKLLGHKRALFVVKVEAPCNYDLHFEYEDMDRWQITKADGASGIPDGL